MSKVQDMFKLAQQGMKPKEIAEKLGVTQQYVTLVFRQFHFDYKKYKKPKEEDHTEGIPVLPKYYLRCYRTRE
jgi:hypothetical protein